MKRVVVFDQAVGQLLALSPEQVGDEVANLYWWSDIPTTEIRAAYQISSLQELHRRVGPALLPFECAQCEGPIVESSRAKVVERLKALVNPSPWTDPRICKTCRDRARQEESRAHRERLRALEERFNLLRTMPYREYLQTEEWRATRTQALRRAGFRCQTCSATGRLHVHHRTYVRRGSERPSDLVVLCAACHEVFHQSRKLAEGGRADA